MMAYGRSLFLLLGVRTLNSLISVELARGLTLKLYLAKRCGCPLQSIRINDIYRCLTWLLILVLTRRLELIILLLVLILLV
jgi:hypothetical protein